ncbi:DUF4214 domain-containing protein [Pseudomonas moraviensis]|uniref:DUF4214 domain-containing protein n=1 Tax=Pseudomonas moraviensis R28-S TaxID=1395516 RepID=V8RCD1_9PSED|nr:DUF4214 domain-containing protein [Pseudomonas moraviensis]ETF09776.1 hypothetical protein PMO01_03225 [Pseudomonas moraviensis R28-S]
MATTSAQVQQLYVAYLGRAADKAGLDYWMAELNATPAVLTLENLRANFVNEQPEYSDAYAGLSRQDTVIKIYNNLFGRAPDAAGLEYWTTGAGSNVNADQLLTAFISGASAADAKVIANKVLVSEVYTSTAGANYVKDDATSILAGVDGTADSVGKAIIKLEDGSLAGIAIPAGVAALKADALADKAVVDFKDSKVVELVALNKEIVDLNTKSAIGATLTDLVTPAAGVEQTYDDVDQALTNATALRTKIGGATSVLEASAKQAAVDLAATRDTYTKATVGNVDKAIAYEKAIATNASLKKADTAAVSSATAKTDVDFTAAKGAAGGTDALAKANADAGLTTAVTDAASLYTALTNADASIAEIAAITKAFDAFLGSSTDYATLKSLAATDYAKAVAVDAEAEAAAAITGTGAAAYMQDVTDKIAADKTYADAQAADALVAKATAVTNALTALEKVADDTKVPTFVKDLAATNTGVDNKADLFHFVDNKVVAAADFSVTKFAAGDAIYVGEGYTLNTAATFDSATNLYTGSNTSALEVFFGKNAGGDVTVTVEANAVGNVAAAGTTDNVSVITLTGVTDVAQVSFANGVISHVA